MAFTEQQIDPQSRVRRSLRIDPVYASEVRAYIKEDRAGSERARSFERWCKRASEYIHDPRNRDKVLAETRAVIAKAFLSEQDPFTEDEKRDLCARDRDLEAFVRTSREKRDLGPSQVHTDTVMAEMSVRFTNPDNIGLMLAEPISVGKESNIYAYYDERDNLAFPDNAVGAQGQLAEVNQGINITDNTYNCVQRGLFERVTPREIANADVPLSPLFDAGLLVAEGNAWNREVSDAAFYEADANYAAANITNVNPTEEYDSAGGGNPNKQIQDATIRIFKTRGATAVRGAMSIETFMVLARHPTIRDLFKYTRDGFATRQQLAGYYGWDDLLVGEAWKDTANKGSSASYARIWSDKIIVVAQNPGMGVRSYSHSKRFRKGPVKSQTLFVQHLGVEGEFHQKESYLEVVKSVAPRAGSKINNCLV